MVEARRLQPDLKLLLTSGSSVAEARLVESAEKVPLFKKTQNLIELYHLIREVLDQ